MTEAKTYPMRRGLEPDSASDSPPCSSGSCACAAWRTSSSSGSWADLLFRSAAELTRKPMAKKKTAGSSFGGGPWRAGVHAGNRSIDRYGFTGSTWSASVSIKRIVVSYWNLFLFQYEYVVLFRLGNIFYFIHPRNCCRPKYILFSVDEFQFCGPKYILHKTFS